MRPSLSHQAQAHLAMTPLMRRSVHQLQMSSLEFLQEVHDVLDANPFLEGEAGAEESDGATTASEASANDAGVSDSSSEVAPLDAVPDRFEGLESFEAATGEGADGGGEAGVDPFADPAASLNGSDGSAEGLGIGDTWQSVDGGRESRPYDDDWDPVLQVPDAPSLREHLSQQAGCLRVEPRERALLQAVIDALEPSGYLQGGLEELVECCGFQDPPSVEELEDALERVQAMDPPGVGARDVRECLLLQLRAMPASTPGRDLAMAVVADHLDVLASREFHRIHKALECDEDSFGEARMLIRSLSPRPGSAFARDHTEYVVPDVIVQKVKGKWSATVNPAVIPKVRVNELYAQILARNRDSRGDQLSHRMQEARWLVRGIEQRFTTIQRIAQTIVERQSRFFDYGDMAMKPMTLRELAEIIGLHESTVSRATTRKYMATPRGLIEFKKFFSSHLETATGAPASSTAVREMIRQLIHREEPAKPLSDHKLARMLEQRGVRVARRTVSKYRDLLQIPPVDVRKLANRSSAARAE